MKNPEKRAFSLSRVGKNRISQGAEKRGSLISAPLALREYNWHFHPPPSIRKAYKSVTVSGGCHPDPRLCPILGPSRSHPGSEVVPSRFAMCFVLQCFGPIQVARWGPSRPVLVPSCSRAFLTGSGLDGQKQTSWPLPILKQPRGSPLKGRILWAWGFSSRKNQKMPGAHKIGAAIFRPQNCGRKFYGHQAFSE